MTNTIVPQGTIKRILQQEIKGTDTKQVSDEAVTSLCNHLDDHINVVVSEAANSNYFKVRPLDISRGIEKSELLGMKKYVDKYESLIGLKIELAERMRRIEHDV